MVRMIDSSMGANSEVKYPARFHHRVIVEDGRCDICALEAALAPFKVVEALRPTNRSAAGSYRGYSVAVEVASCEQLHQLDCALKAVPGVRMVL